MDADELPAPLDNRELRQAMEVLKVFSQDDMARELYEGRLKAERDAKMHFVDAQRVQAQLTQAQRQCQELEQQRRDAEQQLLQELARRIQFCERLLARPVTDTTVLLQRSPAALQETADGLEQQWLRAQPQPPPEPGIR